MPRPRESFAEYGVTLGYDTGTGIRMDDLDARLRGYVGIRRLREMRDDDPTVGAILAGIEMLARGADWLFTPPTPTSSKEGAEFMTELMDDMEFTFEEFLSDVMSMLPYGFSLFEVVMKRRGDGKIGIAKLGPRAQWTIERFDTDPQGEFLGAFQNSALNVGGQVYLPASRLLLFRTTSANCDPAGRSILRNAYRSYLYVKHIQEYEAVAIERELNGMPIGRVPSKYLRPDASEAEKAFLNTFRQILRDVKKNEQGYVLLPSDVYADDDGKPSTQRMVEFELLASKGTRDIDTRAVINGHQQDIARTVLADFLMLGSSDRGSFAMSKSKTDIFVKAMKSFLNSITNPINRRLIPAVWKANGFPPETMPKLVYQNMQPIDLDVLGKFLRSLSLAGGRMFPNEALENAALKVAGMPELAGSGTERDRPQSPKGVANPAAMDENDDQMEREEREEDDDESVR